MSRRHRGRRLSCAYLVLVAALAMARPADGDDQIYFSSNTNVTNILVQYINQETVRLDVSSWYLSEHSISIAIANRFHAGVPVRLIGDRGALFEADPNTKKEFYWLASQGIPIRLRFNPTWYPEIDHWKMAIFVGQNVVEFGSGNFAPTELAPVCPPSATNCTHNYDDDSEMFTSDPALVGAFLTKFDVIWNDTTTEPESMIGGPPYLKDWNDACRNEPTGNCSDYSTQYPNPAPMVINTARLEPNNPTPADLIWGQGSDFNNRMIQEINNENTAINIVVYRLEVPELMQALLDKFRAGVRVRVIVDPAQYTNIVWPEYWLTHAYIDMLYEAGVPVRQTHHQGVTHMKTLITSNYATNASSNFGPMWQRDHDYFVSASTKPAIYQAFVSQFNTMWNDTTDFVPLITTPPNAVDTSTADTVPQPSQNNVSVTTTFTWDRAAWATSYDLYLGTSPSAMSLVANVPAQLVLNPPAIYSWTPSSALNFSTTYYWKVVSRTFAGMTAPSSIQAFSTPTSGSPTPRAIEDFDGDRKTDIAIYRPATGVWWILKSSGNFTTAASYQWGESTDIPVSGDFDGDGKADIAVYRPATGVWWILKSSSNFTADASYQWGVSTDIPVAGDYDGDGKADIAVYRPSTGYWYILKSSTNFTAWASYQWGVDGDMPVPGDFDGDGKADVAV
jgi:hypothetical protein